MGLDTNKFEDWIADHIMSDMISGKGGDSYLNSFVQITDYICNPGIKKKNSLILEEFSANYLISLSSGETRLDLLKNKIKLLLKVCYDPPVGDKSDTRANKGHYPTYMFVEKEISEINEKYVYIYPPGFNELVAESYLKRFIKDLQERQYDKVRFLHENGLDTLPNKMPRMDQLPKFQLEFGLMP